MTITEGDTREVPHNIHELKSWPMFFEAFAAGEKLWELRKHDRAFEAGDLICLREFDPTSHTYTGQMGFAQIVRVWSAASFSWILPPPIAPDYCILSLRRVKLEVA